MNNLSSILRKAMIFVVFLLALAVAVFVAVAYAQTGSPDPPGISQIVEGIMSAVGTWAVAWVAYKIKQALGVGGDIFLAIIIPAIGLGVSWLVNKLGEPGNSWLVSFLITLGATWFDQLRRKLQERFS